MTTALLKRVSILCLLLGFAMSEINSDNLVQRRSSRRKRYVAFPEGSTLSIAICMTAQTIMRPAEIFTQSINWGISYDLPNNSAILEDFVAPGYLKRRRNRRDLYQKMELIMESMGYKGRDCILRALCESGSLFRSSGTSGLVEEILRIVFSFPSQKLLSSEPEDHKVYQEAHNLGRESKHKLDIVDVCSVNYSGCSFSLIDLALGYYSNGILFNAAEEL